MDQTPNLKLAYILAAQAQKHITHNEALRALDAIVQLSVLDKDLAEPPSSPDNGDRYIVAAGATDEWAGHDGEIAAFQDGAWAFFEPAEGWIAWVADDGALTAWDGSAWVAAAPMNPVALVGVNATADATNRLAVSSPATLFNHEGNGHQIKINKNGASDTGTILYQTGFSGRAETGLAGDDDYHFKVSADGSAWTEALVIDKDNGEVRFPAAKVGVGAAPGTGFDLDVTGKSLAGLRIRTDLHQNIFQYLKPDGSNLLRSVWDGGFFHHHLGATIYYNLGNNFIVFATTGTGRLMAAWFALDGDPASLTTQGLRIGENSYATAATPNTTPQIHMKSWSWNGSDGFTVGTDFQLRLSQLSTTANDARFGMRRASDATELLSLLVGNGNVGIGQTSPTAKLHVNGAARVGTYTVATLPSASDVGAGSIIYVSDETGGAVPAFSDGTNWRRVTDRAVVS